MNIFIPNHARSRLPRVKLKTITKEELEDIYLHCPDLDYKIRCKIFQTNILRRKFLERVYRVKEDKVFVFQRSGRTTLILITVMPLKYFA